MLVGQRRRLLNYLNRQRRGPLPVSSSRSSASGAEAPRSLGTALDVPMPRCKAAASIRA